MAVSGAYDGLAKAENVPIVIIDELRQRFQGFPAGSFNPSTQSQAVLRRFGLPPRPDPDRQPVLRQTWDRGF